jgi:chromosome segregation ATPase
VKHFLIRLAALFGLVPARRHQALAAQLDDARSGAQAWKAKAGESLGRVKSLEAELRRQSRLVKEARRSASQHGHTDVDKLRTQLAETERELMLAREHLMTIEVKLDILEGAANVLDSRTRHAIRQSTGTGAVV